MPASHIQVSPDSTGKDVDAQSLTSTETGTPTVYRQVIVIGDPTTYGNLAAVTAAGALMALDRKDTNRTMSNLFMAAAVITTATDALISLTGYKAGAAVAATTTPAVVTTGKIYRVQSILLTYISVAAAQQVRFTLRANTSGVVTITSNAVAVWEVGQNAAVAGLTETVTLDFEDGMEFAAGTGLGVSMVGVTAPNTLAAAGYGMLAIHGYEYTP